MEKRAFITELTNRGLHAFGIGGIPSVVCDPAEMQAKISIISGIAEEVGYTESWGISAKRNIPINREPS